MSDNENDELEQPKTIEEHLSTDIIKTQTLNKNGKPRKQLSPEHLEKLAKARQKANDVRKQMQLTSLEEKVVKIKKDTEYLNKSKKPIKEPIKETIIEEPIKETIPVEEPIEEPIVEPEPKPKQKSKKKTKVVIEQSSSDSDEFEPNDNVLFVKRISRKKKEQVKESEQHNYEIEEPPKPKMLTPQQLLLRDSYNHMFDGTFLKTNNRKFY